MGTREDSAALIEALCGRGWDAPVSPDLARARALLAANPDLVRSHVYAAAAAGEPEALRAQLAADPEAAHRPGGPRSWPPVLYAAFSFAHQLPGRDGAVVQGLQVLLEHGASPDAAYFVPENVNGFSALYATIAVTKDRARSDALLAAGASPSDGNSTYHAVETFDLDLLRALGANRIDPDDLSYTIKHAIDMGWTEAIEWFLDQGADPNAVHPEADETTLHWAVKRGAQGEVIRRLLDAGADPNARTRTGRAAYLPILGWTPYDFALRLGHGEAAALMESAGATRAATGPEEQLVHAVARGDEAGARALLGRHPGLFERLPPEDRGLLPHWAQHGRREAVALACALGFELDATAWLDLPAVHWAALRGDVALLRTLLDAGAPVADLGGEFGTPAHTARTCRWYADGDYEGVLALLAERA